ncbi:hypothetical protein CPLU01_09266 [Colletotrichum plurivorum]|uniref:Uncharacterized protein n=1 Tax=Colletotrichum plurivorum TaxID=2175906 RepID=A0A8H6K9N7_9PEZI|nr:hypothetical protein CPLU01_09266 [Colletotrichum plurivorum]
MDGRVSQYRRHKEASPVSQIHSQGHYSGF